MKRKTFIAFMVIFTAYISVILLVSLVCGASMENRTELYRYLFGAVGMSIMLPGGFSLFFISTLDLSKKLDEMEEEAKHKEDGKIFDTMDIDVSILSPGDSIWMPLWVTVLMMIWLWCIIILQFISLSGIELISGQYWQGHVKFL